MLVNNNKIEKGRVLQKFVNELLDHLYNKWRKLTTEQASGQPTQNPC